VIEKVKRPSAIHRKWLERFGTPFTKHIHQLAMKACPVCDDGIDVIALGLKDPTSEAERMSDLFSLCVE
jgi:hypothetical protein